MSYLRLGMFAILLSFATDSLAWACCNLTEVKEECQPHWYASIGIGDSVDYRAGTGQYSPILLVPIPTSFSPNYNSSPIYFQGELGYIWNHPFTSDLNNRFFPFMSLGVQYRYTTPVTIDTSVILAFTTPVDLDIPYRIEQNSALLTWKIDFYQWFNRLMPYLNLGLGASWNHTSQKEAITDVTGLINTSSKTNTDWNYNIGVGLDFIVATNFWLSLGYSYDHFGQLQLGQLNFTPDGGLNSGFQSVDIGNLHAHNIIFTARYLFG